VCRQSGSGAGELPSPAPEEYVQMIFTSPVSGYTPARPPLHSTAAARVA
jgi:hypothetical protein